MRVTAMIAAGAVLDLGAPTTGQLTSAVRKVTQTRPDLSKVHFLEQIADMVDAAAKPVLANFEDYLQAIESLLSMYWGRQPRTAWPFKPVISAFSPQIDAKWLDQFLLLSAQGDLFGTIGAEILSYMSGFNAGNHRWFSDFWAAAVCRCHWDIATTNYDDSIERCIPPHVWRDGYVPLDPGLSRFDPHELACTDRSRLLHLHGSVKFGYPRFADPNRFIFEDDHEDLYKYDDPALAMKTWFGRSTNKAQSHEDAIAGPMITGLRKADKTMYHPYDAYHVTFHEAVRQSPRLLVAGYSFGDHHLNHVLQRITRLHGDNRRVVLITHFGQDPDRWCYDPGVMGWPASHEMSHFIASAFRDRAPYPMEYTNPMVSKDGRGKVYLGGMKKTLEDHGSEIVSFLTQ